jgi:hypothetical protein
VTEPITYIFDPRDPAITEQQLQQYKSQNWDIFSIPDSLIQEYQRLGILTLEDNTNNLVISLSYGGIDPTEFYEAIHNRDRHGFFKTTEKQGINHTLYRIVNGQLKFIHHLQKSIPNEIVRFTGCYIDHLYDNKLYAITTNAYPKNILNKGIVNEIGQIPHQEIVLAKLNPISGLYDDVIIKEENIKLEDHDALYFSKHLEWRDPNVYNTEVDFVDFVFCARDEFGQPCVGRGRMDFIKWTMTTLPPIIIPNPEQYLYLECPQIFADPEGNQWLLVSVGDIDGSHYQSCWYQKNGEWVKINGHGRFATEFPGHYTGYGGKFVRSGNVVRYICWLADESGTPSSILMPTEVIFDFDTGECYLKPFTAQHIESKSDETLDKLVMKNLVDK